MKAGQLCSATWIRKSNMSEISDTIQIRKLNAIIKNHFLAAIVRIILFAVTVIFVFTCVFGIKTTESNDMYPAVRAGDVVLFYRLSEPKDMDVVLYKTTDGENIGRVIACENTEIAETSKGEITINGDIQPIQKPQGVFYQTFGKGDTLTVGKNEYYILGDERDDAKDSRVYGAIKRKDIKGKVFMILRRRAI